MRKSYPWLVLAVIVLFTVAVYNRLPDRVPTHWDLHGVVNGESSRAAAALILPFIVAVIAIVMPLLPAIDPRRLNFDKFRPTYDLVVNAVITMLAVMHVLILGAALGWPISMTRVVPATVGAMLIVLGNVLPRARPNWWFGIRTPWTLSNDRVWERTHRLGGYLFVGAGVTVLFAALLPEMFAVPVLITVCLVATVIPLVFSYFAWKQEATHETRIDT